MPKKRVVRHIHQKEEMKDITKKRHKTEIIIESVLAVLLIVSLLLEGLINLSQYITTGIIASFIIIKIHKIIKREGTIFEEYTSVIGIVLLGLIHFFLHEAANFALIIAAIFVLLYSMGTIIKLRHLLQSRNIITFLLSYAIFILMIIFLFSGAYSTNNSLFSENGLETTLAFEDTIYFSIVTFTTVGYGDIAPKGVNRLIASIEAVIAIVLNIGFIGYVLASKRFRR